MALSYADSQCQNCLKLALAASKRGDTQGLLKYGAGGTYEKISESEPSFSYSKALVGTAVFGAVGAVAGINGKKTVTYKCNKCGHIMTRNE